MRKKYLYTFPNYKLKLARRGLRSCPGLYLFYGESGTGKTTYLRDVFSDKNVLWLSSEQMKQMMIDDILKKTPISAGNYRYIVIDNIEDFRGEALLRKFAEIIDGCVDEGIVVAMTECSSDGNVLPTRNSIKLFKVKRVSVDSRVVRKYAALIGKKISIKDARNIAESCKNMNSVSGMVLRYSEKMNENLREMIIK